MPVESATRHHFDIGNTIPFIPDNRPIKEPAAGNDNSVVVFEPFKKRYEKIRARLSFESSTKEYVDFFNTFHREEGLPQSWQNLQYGENQVGFSMDSQMDLLKGDDPESRKVWVKQTRQDLQGFVIEYLSPYIVYPWHHTKRENSDGSANLVDTKYGGKRMVDTVSEKERGGVVKQVIEAIDKAVVEKKVPDKSIFVQWSPMDETATGLTQDNGENIVYTDTHLIVSQVDGDRLDGVTVKTDLTQLETREMIRRLTGKVIPVGAPVEEYIKAVALIDPTQENIARIEDVVTVAADVRADLSFGSNNAYKDKSWDSVREQIGQGDSLYDFNDTMQVILKRFEDDVLADNPSREELPGYIAATVLRISQEAQIAERKTKQIGRPEQPFLQLSFGDTLQKTAAIPGCAGGGSKTAIDGMFGVSRAVNSYPGGGGSTESDERGSLNFKCSKGHPNKRPKGELIPNCMTCGESVAC